MGIYTGRGDGGESSLADGQRRRKDDARLEAYGSLDEVNSLIGFARACCDDPLIGALLEYAQHRLFDCCGTLATPTATESEVTSDDVAVLEHAIDRFGSETGPMKGFVLESGAELACRLHIARAACRRAERRIVTLDVSEPVVPAVLAFVNRLSDALFSAARCANKTAEVAEEPWIKDFPRPTF